MSLNHVCPNCGNPHLEIELAGCTKRLDVHGLWVDADDLTQDELKEAIEQPNTPVSCPRCQWDGYWGELIDTIEMKLDGLQYDAGEDATIPLPTFGVELDTTVDVHPGMILEVQDGMTGRTMRYRIHQVVPVKGIWQKMALFEEQPTTRVTGTMPHFVCVRMEDPPMSNAVIIVSQNRLKEELFHGTWELLPKPVRETTPIEDATRDTLLQQEIEHLRQMRPQFDDAEDVSMDDVFMRDTDHDD